MTRRTNPIRARRAIAVVLAVLVLAGCGKPAGRHAHTGPEAGAGSTVGGTPASPAPSQVPSPAGEAAALDAVAVARAFTAAICPYDWRDPVPYGRRLDTALARWGTPGFAAARGWSPARTATAAAGLAEHQARQACAQLTGGLDPEADPAGGSVTVRLSVTVTDQAAGSATSSAQQVFHYQLVPQAGGRWLISSGQW